jgi:non-ribosomal peptide synthetase component F
MNHTARQALYQAIEAERDSTVIAFVTGERPGLETQIAGDGVTPFVSMLDTVGPQKRLSLLLDTYGGQTSAAWRIINLVHSFCDELEVIVPTKAMSAGTLMALGADKIVMTKQAALGPIDPSLPNHPLAPMTSSATGLPARVPVSAEAVRGYMDEVKKDVTDPASLAAVWTHLASNIHPLVLGDVFRAGGQIRDLASELIGRQVADETKQQAIIQLLCSDSGSHDYTINRRKAADIGLNVEKPSAQLYGLLTQVVQSWTSELETYVPFSHSALLGGHAAANYTLIRGLVESRIDSYGFVTEGQVNVAPTGLPNVVDQRTFEGWRKL